MQWHAWIQYERLQKEYQALELEKEALELSIMIMEGEKKEFENKILELEAQKSAASRQAGELRAQVEELEEHNRSLETQLKAANERHLDITPFQEQEFLIWWKIYQVQLKLVEEVYKIKQVESRLQEISAISIDFRTKLLEVAEKV